MLPEQISKHEPEILCICSFWQWRVYWKSIIWSCAHIMPNIHQRAHILWPTGLSLVCNQRNPAWHPTEPVAGPVGSNQPLIRSLILEMHILNYSWLHCWSRLYKSFDQRWGYRKAHLSCLWDSPPTLLSCNKYRALSNMMAWAQEYKVIWKYRSSKVFLQHLHFWHIKSGKTYKWEQILHNYIWILLNRPSRYFGRKLGKPSHFPVLHQELPISSF